MKSRKVAVDYVNKMFCILCLMFIYTSIWAKSILPHNKAFQYRLVLKDRKTIQVSWLVHKGYYIYTDSINFEINNGKGIKAVLLPPGVYVNDPVYGRVKVIDGEFVATIKLNESIIFSNDVQLSVAYRGVNYVSGMLYSPHKNIFRLTGFTKYINLSAIKQEKRVEKWLRDTAHLTKEQMCKKVVIWEKTIKMSSSNYPYAKAIENCMKMDRRNLSGYYLISVESLREK